MALDVKIVTLVSQDVYNAVYELSDRGEVSMGAWVREAIREKINRLQAAALDAAQDGHQ
jgi:hypothetical protein